LFIIAVALVATLLCIGTLRGNQKLDARIQNIYQPLYLVLKDFNALLGNSQKLSRNWVYQPNAQEKEKLKQIHKSEFVELARNLDAILKQDENDNPDIQSSIKEFNEILAAEKELMITLPADSSYSNDKSVDAAIALLEKKIDPQSESLSKTLTALVLNQEKQMSEAQLQKQSSYTLLTVLLIAMILVFIAASVAAYFYSRKSIVSPIIQLKNTILDIGMGKIVDAKFEKREDEIGEMTQAISSLMVGINTKSKFAELIGKGNYTQQFQLMSEDDSMGKALLEMRENLQQNAEEERKRNWATQGLAEIGNLLRQQTTSAEELYVNIIRFVVKYTKSNQGGLFLLDKTNASNEHLKLVSCFAYDRKKYLEKEIKVGEGMLGQCVLERETIYMIEIPKNYIQITSGLGEAVPTALLIVPLKVNDEIHGILEIASFNKFEKYEISFIEKLGENIASAISSVLANERTKQLLEASQQQSEELKAQEEEMRQNMEELTATQEEIHRKQKENEEIIKAIDTSMSVIEFDPSGKILKANANFLQLMEYPFSEIQEKHHKMFMTQEESVSKEYKTFWEKLRLGETIKGDFRRIAKSGKSVWIRGNYSPQLDKNGKVSKVIKVAYDITENKN
jgi:PAS domain S-box-containing protein